MSLNTVTQKILLIAGMVFISLTEGHILGMMSAMVVGLQSENAHTKYTNSQISWLVSSIHVMGLFGFGLAALITERVGRRRALTILTCPVIIHWLIVYFEHRFAVLMASTTLLGICFGGVLSLTLLATAEYTSPNIRGAYLSFIMSGGPALGVTTAHILSTVINWKKVAIMGIAPATLAAVIPCFWVESPTWLASKGRFQECEAAFKSLHGDSKEAQRELKILIEVETCKQSKTSQAPSASVYKKLWIALRKKYFWKIAAIVFVLHIYRIASGKLLFASFMITILQNVTGSADLFLFAMLVDGVGISGCALSCYFNSRFKMRTVLLSTGVLANIILAGLSACLYFKPANDINYIWLSCVLIALYYVTGASGVFPLIESLFAEIFPLELKTYCFFGFGTIGSGLVFLSLQTALTMFNALGYHGVFLMYAVIGSFCLLFLGLKLPETKGRTLQEIELYFKNGTFDNINFDSEQCDNLLDKNIKI